MMCCLEIGISCPDSIPDIGRYMTNNEDSAHGIARGFYRYQTAESWHRM